MTSPSPRLKFNNGLSISQLGLGLWQLKEREQCIEGVSWALQAGYRHFDCAQYYQNEAYLGEAVAASKIDRKDVFITTKIAINKFGFKHTLSSFEDSLKRLKMEYVDLLLLHFPVPLLRDKSWKALVQIQQSGRAKSIGVSNYTIRHLETLLENSSSKPAINQVELHVFLQQRQLVKFCKNHDIMLEAYSPLAHGQALADPQLIKIAKKHQKSVAQIMIRWCVQQGYVVIPKSSNKDRIEQNIDVFDFKLDAEDLANIEQLDRGMRTCWNPTHVP